MLALVSLQRAVPVIVGVFVPCTGNAAAQDSGNSNAKQEEEAFYQRYPDLRAHNEIVQTAFDQLKRSGFQAKTLTEAQKAIALNAYVLLNQNSSATSSGEQSQQPKIPYWLVLEEYNRARSEEPVLKDMSLQEFAIRMNDISGSRAYDEGLHDNWLRRVGTSIDTSFINSWGFVVLVAMLGLILLLIVFRVTARRPTMGEEDHRKSASAPPRPPPPRGSSSYISEEELAHARVLGLQGRITFEDIKRCHRERMQEYHPDKVNSLGQKLRELADSEAKKINVAYEFFRRKYDPNA